MNPRATDLFAFAIIASSPFVNAFAPTNTLPIPYIIFILSIPTFLLSKHNITRNSLIIITILTATFCYSLSLSLLKSSNHLTTTTVNHYLSWGFVTSFFYFSLNSITTKTRAHYIEKGLSIALLLTSTFVLLEILVGLLFDIRLGDLLPRPSVSKIKATLLGTTFRPRGFAEEPGHMSIFFEFAIPAYIFLGKRSTYKIGLLTLACTAWLCLFSAASFISLFAAILIIGTIHFTKNPKALLKPKTTGYFALATIITLTLLASIPPEAKHYAYNASIGKLVRLNEGLSATNTNERAIRYSSAIQLIKANPSGIGWGTAASTNGSYKGTEHPPGFVSLPLEITVSLGLVGLSIIILLATTNIFFLSKVKNRALALCELWPLLHLVAISNYWLPWPWLGIALCINFYKEKDNRHS